MSAALLATKSGEEWKKHAVAEVCSICYIELNDRTHDLPKSQLDDDANCLDGVVILPLC